MTVAEKEQYDKRYEEMLKHITFLPTRTITNEQLNEIRHISTESAWAGSCDKPPVI